MYEQAAESGHSCPPLPLPEGFYYPGDEEEWNAAVACVSYPLIVLMWALRGYHRVGSKRLSWSGL